MITGKELNQILENGYDAYKDRQEKAPYSVPDDKFSRGKDWMASDKKALNDKLKFTVFYNEGLKIYALYIRETSVDEHEWTKVFVNVNAFMKHHGYKLDQSSLKES